MKKILSFTVIILCALLLLPLAKLKASDNTIEVISPTTPLKTDTFRIYNTETKEIKEIPVNDYLFGVVAAEMPLLYNEEALKAQAVAAYTFALYRKNENADKEYDLTDNHLTDQSYITKEEAISRWGQNADTYREKLNNILNDIENYTITYNNEPILAVYHAISYGKTEDAENIWGKNYPYLKSVTSYGDKLCDGYITTVSIPKENFKELLKTKIDFSKHSEITLSDRECTSAGTVKKIKICNTEFKGSEIREIFSLRSSNFTIEHTDDSFNFTVYGYGHSVGLSQTGAEYMANEGSNFKEILAHYYQNCQIEKLS